MHSHSQNMKILHISQSDLTMETFLKETFPRASVLWYFFGAVILTVLERASQFKHLNIYRLTSCFGTIVSR